jgi:hypothetical protein
LRKCHHVLRHCLKGDLCLGEAKDRLEHAC